MHGLVYIKTFGCQMNDRDSQALLGILMQKNYQKTEEIAEADVILVNTCSVRQHAEDRAISFLGSLKKLSNKKDKRIIGLVGCMAKQRGEEIFKKMLHIDLVVSPSRLYKIPEYIEKIKNQPQQKNNQRLRIIDLNYDKPVEEFYLAGYNNIDKHAQIVISRGCSNYCSYCVVPYVRGELQLRRPEDIIEEIKKNVKEGVKKITLLGQNVNDYNYKYQGKIVSFLDLLEMIEKIEGLVELDFITAHPKNTSIELFKFMANSKKIKKHLHLPFQSGSNRILKLMNRGYTKEEYLNLIDAYKKIVNGTLSTDVIVGFPTETDEDFLETKDVLKKVRFLYAYIFKYSPRPNTEAAKLIDDVPEKIKSKRHKCLLDLQKRISSSFKK